MDKEQLTNLLDKAAKICVINHAGQRDKSGQAYFQHPMRVAMRCHTDEEKIVALLHDIIEDTDITPEYLLAEGFPQYIVDAILSVTKRDGENYDDFVARAKQNPIGKVVKMRDLEDNLDVMRLDTFTPDMAQRFAKYLNAYHFLKSELAETDKNDEIVAMNDAEPAPMREISTLGEIYSSLRAEENRKIKVREKNTGGSDRMKSRLIIRDKDKTVINETSIYETLAKLGRLIGFDNIDEAKVKVKKGEYDYYLVRRTTKSKFFKSHSSGWMLLADAPVTSVALALNELFDKIGARLIATIVDR